MLTLFALFHTLCADSDESLPQRSGSGLLVFYDFVTDESGLVIDRSNVGVPINLTIEEPDAVQWTGRSLRITESTRIQSSKPTDKIINAIQWSGELTIEAWIQPAKTDQDGPARIVTYSQNGSQRNFTLGQDGPRADVRLRTTTTSANGMPSLNSDETSLDTSTTHVVYTRNREGLARLYINGDLANQRTVPGDYLNWRGDFHLGLANEISDSRSWLGEYFLVAVFNRALLPHEIRTHFQAGPDARLTNDREDRIASALFTEHIAPMFVKHCFECHDASGNKGGLDLSSRQALSKGSSMGDTLSAGAPDESILLAMVDADLMPLDREPLSPDEKTALRQWIADGAQWPVDSIDPVLYAHGSSARSVWVQRLTRPEYIETVKRTLGVDIKDEALKRLPPDIRADGFSNTAYNLTVDLKHIQAYQGLAETVVSKMDVEEFARRFSKNDKLTDNHMRRFIADMGEWVLRGPLSEDEIAIYRGVSTAVASAGGGFDEAVASILKAMLQSPRFIYRIENQRGDGSPWPLSGYELASRLSYMLWGGPPDETLLKAARSGALLSRDELNRQIARMLDDPRAVDRSLQFFSEWLNLGGLSNLRPSDEKFPDWTPEIAEDMRKESLAFFEYVAWELDRPLSDLFNAQSTFLTQRLALHYGLEPSASHEKANQLIRYDLSSIPSRGGLLTHGSVLTKGGDEASMVTRGLFVLHDVLRGSVQDPPPCVDTSPQPSEPGLSQRLISEQRVANPACGGCHVKFEPLAFGLEKFDGVGSYHEVDEHGNELRDDGAILFPGLAKSIEYESSTELMDRLAQSDRVKSTITWKAAQFAMGRPLTAYDAPVIAQIHERSQEAGGTYRDLMAALASSDLTLLKQTEAHP